MSEPYFLLSKKIVFEQLAKIEELCDEVSYSLKTNYEVGKILEGKCWFSVHSVQELKLLNDKSKVWFFAQGWDEIQVNEITKLGANSFVVDNIKDLEVLLNFIGKADFEINLLLRMRLKEHTVHTGKHFVFGFFSQKINELIPELKENKKVARLGVHFHRKTQNISEWSLKQELEQSLSEKTLELVDCVNVGGGIPSNYKNFRAEVLEHIFKKILELKVWLNEKKVKIILEPGRFIAAPSVKLITHVKTIYDDDIIVNASVYNSAMDTFIANIRLLVEGEKESGNPYTIKGCTPDSMDIFRYKVYLDSPTVGDEIVFLNAGAYNFSTDFCMLPKLKTKVED